jgi:hypothetical protein
MSYEMIDMTDVRVGRLKILAFSHMDKYGAAHWECICSCGNRTTVGGRALRNGLKNKRRTGTHSCGCLSIELTKARARRARVLKAAFKGTAYARKKSK